MTTRMTTTSTPAVPRPPATDTEWRRSRDFLRYLSAQGVPAADDFVVANRQLKYADVHRFFGAINPDPTLGGEDLAFKQRYELGLGERPMPNSLADALTEIRALDAEHVSKPLEALAAYVQQALHFCGNCDQPHFPPWANRSQILRGQRAFMTRLLPSTIVLLCKSLPEAYAAPRPSAVLNLSRQLASLPYHRLLGTLQLLVTVSTPHSFEGPWFPALVAAEEMQLLHAGVRKNVAPRMDAVVPGPVERSFQKWDGPEYLLWGGYTAFRNGWPHSDDKPDADVEPPQEVVNQADMLATIIAFSLLVVDGLRELRVPFDEGDDEAFWHLWRVFAVFKGIHPPDDPTSDAWVPKTLGEARCFWAAYREEYYAKAVTWEAPAWQQTARTDNPAGCALASSHLVMLARFMHEALPLPVTERWCLKVARWFVYRLCGEDGAARIGVPKVHLWPWERWLVEHVPRAITRAMERVDVGMQVAFGRWALTRLIGRVYGSRVIFPIPQTVEDLKRFVETTKLKGQKFAQQVDGA
jgi:hypothetical protein